MTTDSIQKLPKDQRDRIRREQIVEAAIACISRHGLHKATTAAIAKEAGFSEGQMYRYFDSKESIIEAVAEYLTSRHLSRIIAASTSSELADIISRDMTDSSAIRDMERTLFIELHAEATRNPAMADILRRSDQTLKAKAISSLTAEFPHLSADEASGIAEFLAAASEGHLLRAKRTDKKTARNFFATYKRAISRLLEPSTSRQKEESP